MYELTGVVWEYGINRKNKKEKSSMQMYSNEINKETTLQKDVQKRIDYIDFMNIAACFGVVCLHCSGSVHLYGSVERRLWLLSMFVQTLMHFSVPVFFMITGTTLLEYREKYNTKTFFKKRIRRTVIPFLFWTIIYMLLPVIMEGAAIPEKNEWRDAFFANGATDIFWFFYYILGIYLCMPVLSLIAKKENYKVIQYFCLGAFCTVSVYPVITRFVFPVYEGILPQIMGGYIGYVFAGWLIRYEHFSKTVRYMIYGAGICGAILMFFGTWYLSEQAGGLDTFFMDNNSIACFPASVAVMLLGKHISWEKIYGYISQKSIAKAASAGLGIYVIHMIFIRMFDKVPLIYEHPMYITIFAPPVVYFISLGVVLILQKVPVLKRVIP